MDDLKDQDLYGLLGVLQSASVQEIKKAYRKKALSCHPDKNPDNPKAGELFLQLTRALEILIDESARAAYDKVINAKKAAALRNQALDSKRKKLKEDLEARERQAQEDASIFRKTTQTAEEKLKAEIERLRKEGSKQLEEEVEYVRQEILKERNRPVAVEEEETSPAYRLKVRWKSNKIDDDNGGYNNENLNKIFSKYGDIVGLVVSHKKKGSALLEFKTPSAAVKAFQLEKGLPSNPLIMEWLSGVDPPALKQAKDRTTFDNVRVMVDSVPTKASIFPSMQQNTTGKERLFPSFSSAPDMSNKMQQTSGDEDYEAIVLKNLRQAEERKRITEELNEEDT